MHKITVIKLGTEVNFLILDTDNETGEFTAVDGKGQAVKGYSFEEVVVKWLRNYCEFYEESEAFYDD